MNKIQQINFQFTKRSFCVFKVEYKDLTELSRLLQLVLGCATKCDNKREYIRYITTMDESVQRVVMLSLQEVSDVWVTTIGKSN